MEGKTSDQLKETLDGYIDPGKRERMTENVMKGVDSTFFKPAIKRVIKMLDGMEMALQKNLWLAGDTYSLADIAFTPYVNRVSHLQQDWLLESRRNTRNWFGRVCERPSFKVAMADWFIDDFLTLMEAKGQESQEGVQAIVSEI